MHDDDARSDRADQTAAVPTARPRARSGAPARSRSGGALATLAALGLVVAVSIGVAAVQDGGQSGNIRLARAAVTA